MYLKHATLIRCVIMFLHFYYYCLSLFWFWIETIRMPEKRQWKLKNINAQRSKWRFLRKIIVWCSKYTNNFIRLFEHFLPSFSIRYLRKKTCNSPAKKGKKSINYKHKLSLSWNIYKYMYVFVYVLLVASRSILLKLCSIWTDFHVCVCVHLSTLLLWFRRLHSRIYTRTFCPFFSCYFCCDAFNRNPVGCEFTLFTFTINSHLYLCICSTEHCCFYFKVIIQCAHEFPLCICSIQNHHCRHTQTLFFFFINIVFAIISLLFFFLSSKQLKNFDH